jgi:hypothetical protein
VAGAGYLVLAATSLPAVAVVGYGMEAVGVALGNVATMSLRYRIIPTDLFGRVNNTFRTAVLSAGLAGALAGGVITEHSSLHATFLSAGLLQLALVAVLGSRLARDVSRLPA